MTPQPGSSVAGSFWPLEMSQIDKFPFGSVPGRDAVPTASCLPSGEKSSAKTTWSIRNGSPIIRPVLVSHRQTWMSALPEARRLPSGEQIQCRCAQRAPESSSWHVPQVHVKLCYDRAGTRCNATVSVWSSGENAGPTRIGYRSKLIVGSGTRSRRIRHFATSSMASVYAAVWRPETA